MKHDWDRVLEWTDNYVWPLRLLGIGIASAAYTGLYLAQTAMPSWARQTLAWTALIAVWVLMASIIGDALFTPTDWRHNLITLGPAVGMIALYVINGGVCSTELFLVSLFGGMILITAWLVVLTAPKY